MDYLMMIMYNSVIILINCINIYKNITWYFINIIFILFNITNNNLLMCYFK